MGAAASSKFEVKVPLSDTFAVLALDLTFYPAVGDFWAEEISVVDAISGTPAEMRSRFEYIQAHPETYAKINYPHNTCGRIPPPRIPYAYTIINNITLFTHLGQETVKL